MPGVLDPLIHRKLHRLRRALRLAVIFQGTAWWLALLAAAALVTFAVDYGAYLLTMQHLTLYQRLAVSGLCLAALAAAAWRGVLRPALARVPLEDLALMLERRYPELGDRLISALQLTAPDSIGAERLGLSPQLVGRLVAQTNAAAAPLAVGAVIRGDRLLRSAGLVLAAAAVVAGCGAWRGDLMALWFRRTVLLADEHWPRDTYLTVIAGPRFRVARGEPLEITVAADPAHVVPPQVVLHLKFSTADAVEEAVDQSPTGPLYVKKFDSVTESFRFHVTGNDDRTGDCLVEIDEPPQLADVLITIEKPAYMRENPVQAPGSAGTLNVPPGSVLTLRGRSTKDLSRATLLLDGVETGRCVISSISEGGAGVVARPPTGEDARGSRPRAIAARLIIEPERPFRPSRDLRIVLADSEGFTNSRAAQYHLAILPDRPPTVQFSARGVGSNVTTKARIPYLVEAQDDHGLRLFTLEWSATTSEKPVRTGVLELDPPEKERRYEGVLDLEPLVREKTTDKAPFNLGDTLRLLVRVQDSLPGPEGPNETVSSPLLFKLTSEEDLLAALSENQHAAQEEFRQVLLIQSEALEKTAAAVDAANATDARRLTGESANLQQQLQDRVTVTTGRFEEVLERMNNNRIGSEPERWHLRTRVIDPLRSLTGGALRSVGADLVAARGLEDAAALRRLLPGILQAQRQVHERMGAILGEMIRIENAQQVEREWRAIIEQTQKVKNILENERKE